MGRLAQLVDDRFKGPVVPFENRLITSVGTTATRFLRVDGDRLGFVFVNLSVNDMFIGWFPDVSSSKGARVGPSGGSAVAIWEEDFLVLGAEWFVVATAAASALYYTEYIATSGPKA